MRCVKQTDLVVSLMTIRGIHAFRDDIIKPIYLIVVWSGNFMSVLSRVWSMNSSSKKPTLHYLSAI